MKALRLIDATIITGALLGLGGVFLHLDAELNFFRLFNEEIANFSRQTVESRQREAFGAVGLDLPGSS